MILGWSPHQAGTGHGEPARYFLSPRVEKRVGSSRELITRDPAPELLLGDPVLFQKSVQSLKFKMRYRAATMTFSEPDIDVTAFNRGDPQPRHAAAACAEIFLEMVWAGVPKRNRLPVLIGTHSHTGRLELNFALPRGVWNSKGQVRSFNPHPPTKGSRNDFDAVVDLLNQHFGYEDPRCPDRERPIKTADWIEKTVAEADRNGTEFTPASPIPFLWYMLKIQENEIETRDDLLDRIRDLTKGTDLEIIDRTDDALVIDNPATSGVPMVLRGRLVRDGPVSDLDEITVRQSILRQSDARFQSQWEKRAEWNSERYSKGVWNIAHPDPAEILKAPRLRISLRHPDFITTSSNRRSGALARLSEFIAKLADRLNNQLILGPALPSVIDALSVSIGHLNKTLEELNDRIRQRNDVSRNGSAYARDDRSSQKGLAEQRFGKGIGADRRIDPRATCRRTADEVYGECPSAVGNAGNRIVEHRAAAGAAGSTDPGNSWRTELVSRELGLRGRPRRIDLLMAALRTRDAVLPNEGVAVMLIVARHSRRTAVRLKSEQFTVYLSQDGVEVEEGSIELRRVEKLRELFLESLMGHVNRGKTASEDHSPAPDM